MTTAHKANLALLIAGTSRRGEGREALEVLSPATSTPIVAPPVANPAMLGEKHRGQASGAACHRVSEQQRQHFCPSRCPTSGGGAAVLHIAELRGGKARRAGLWHRRISGDNRPLSSARSAHRITSAGLVQPCCSTQTIALHLADRALGQAPGPHALALTVQAGWLATAKRKTPSTISIIAPPSAPS